MEKVSVKNAADEGQVRKAAERAKSMREKELNDIAALLQTDYGRRFIWRLLGHCKVFGSVWESSAKIHYNSGVQDVGHFLLAEVTEADPDSLIKMMKENKGDN